MTLVGESRIEIHEHDWHLVQVNFDEDVSEYACSGCDEVWFA